jgi:hypothetical protein
MHFGMPVVPDEYTMINGCMKETFSQTSLLDGAFAKNSFKV